MNGFTSEQLRDAAKLARARGKNLWADDWDKEAEQMERLADYAASLLLKVREKAKPYEYGEADHKKWHMFLVAFLIEDGWTPPEELLYG